MSKSLGNFIEYVPHELAANLQWRLRMRELALVDKGIQRAIRDACFGDLLFFIQAMCWLVEPRGQQKILPFCLWPHQPSVLLEMDQAITDSELTELPIALTVKKSRAQGATYIFIYVLIRRFLRDSMFSAGLVTRNEKTVDSVSDQDTLLWKVWWGLEQLPYWMLPADFNLKDHRSLSDHTISNPENGSLFTGYAATGDLARGGRRTVFVCDEFGSEEFISAGKDYRVVSSISSVSNCLMFVSTFGGETGVFYESATDPDNPRLLTLDWKDNPTQTKNAYVVRDGKAMAVRPDEQSAVDKYAKSHASQMKKLDRRGHVLEGKFRSPWYDAYCLLPGATPRFVARELDMDPRGASGKVFAVDVLDRRTAVDNSRGRSRHPRVP